MLNAAVRNAIICYVVLEIQNAMIVKSKIAPRTIQSSGERAAVLNGSNPTRPEKRKKSSVRTTFSFLRKSNITVRKWGKEKRLGAQNYFGNSFLICSATDRNAVASLCSSK